MGLFDRLLNRVQNKEAEAPATKPGRNELCWCGSGKKYKQCHLTADEKRAEKTVCSLNCGPS